MHLPKILFNFKQKCQLAHQPNAYTPALGLITHFDRDRSGASHRGR
jgi:hypothetical protein